MGQLASSSAPEDLRGTLSVVLSFVSAVLFVVLSFTLASSYSIFPSLTTEQRLDFCWPLTWWAISSVF